MLKIAAPRSLAAVPLLLLAGENPAAYQVEFFTDHADAVHGLKDGRFDLLATGFSELNRSELVCTYVWGLSALLVRDSAVKTVVDLSRYCDNNSAAEIVLPFAGSPLDLQVRALFTHLSPDASLRFSNRPLTETLPQFLAGTVFAAVLPEPMATTLELAGKATRLADLAELCAQITGEARSPQVSLFARQTLQLPADFWSQFKHCISLAHIMSPSQRSTVAAALNIAEPVLGHALRHVRFELPDSAVAKPLEDAYRQFIDAAIEPKNAPA